MRHIQLPNNMTKEAILTPQDLLVYVSIKRYMNKDTKEAFPSLLTISSHCGASIPTIRKSIKRLEEQGYLKITKQGRKQIYTFLKFTNFEPFSYEFLDKTDLTFTEKSYLIASQQYMFKDIEKFGKISMTDEELSKILNLSRPVITKCNNSLKNKGYLDIIKAKQSKTGITINEKFFHLDELGQAIVFKLQDHEEKINKNAQDIKELQKSVELILKENAELKRKLEENYKTEFIL